jgi:hypothetical protein
MNGNRQFLGIGFEIDFDFTWVGTRFGCKTHFLVNCLNQLFPAFISFSYCRPSKLHCSEA